MDYETMNQEEWSLKGLELYGEDSLKWKFKCPICGNIQTPEDFRQYKDQGATPESARLECIGRYMPKEKVNTAFGNDNSNIKSPCDYTACGLFKIGHKIKLENGETTIAFPFADQNNKNNGGKEDE